MKKIIVFLLLIIFLISSKPISLTDREFVFLYFCNMNGEYEFDDDGRKGLATISAIKKQESKRQDNHRGQVFLISGKNFSGEGDKFKAHFGLLNKVGFDAVFISEEGLQYLELNPSLKNLNLPLIVNRENKFSAEKEIHIKSEGIHFRISNSLSELEDKSVDVQLLFNMQGSYDYIKESNFEKPIYLFLDKSEISSFSFKKNIYTVQCPEPEKLGKLTLYFRKNALIRQRQEFIPLNTSDLNNSWIEPDREIINELK